MLRTKLVTARPLSFPALGKVRYSDRKKNKYSYYLCFHLSSKHLWETCQLNLPGFTVQNLLIISSPLSHRLLQGPATMLKAGSTKAMFAASDGIKISRVIGCLSTRDHHQQQQQQQQQSLFAPGYTRDDLRLLRGLPSAVSPGAAATATLQQQPVRFAISLVPQSLMIPFTMTPLQQE
jgi:hypothetical protein